MKRRQFITLLGATAAWPLAARAQQPRRIGVLMAFAENDLEAKTYLSAFTLGLAELGWTDGRNMRLDVRWAASNVDLMHKFAKELVDLQPVSQIRRWRPLRFRALHRPCQSYLRSLETRSAPAS